MPASVQLEQEAVDLTVQNHGSVYLVRGLTQAGGEFLLDADGEAQYWGGALAVEPGYIASVVELARRRGLRVR